MEDKDKALSQTSGIRVKFQDFTYCKRINFHVVPTIFHDFLMKLKFVKINTVK
jgi:hypothetical protein